MALSTSSWAQRASVTSEITQPLRDLGIMRVEPLEVLARAASAPYAVPNALPNGAMDCIALTADIVSLELALGPDLDAAVNANRRSLTSQAVSGASNLIVDAIGDVVSLPYSGFIRRVTGAERRDREIREAIQAGMVRRAFLKGIHSRECATPEAPLPDVDMAALEDAGQTFEVQTYAVSDPTPASETAPEQPPVVLASAETAPTQADAALQPVADTRIATIQ